MFRIRRTFPNLFVAAVTVVAVSFAISDPSYAQAEHQRVRLRAPKPGPVLDVKPAVLAGQAVVNFEQLSHRPPSGQTARPLILEPEVEEPAEPVSLAAPSGPETPGTPLVASPPPTLSFMGLNDIPMVDSSYIVIPPDVGGAVGPTKVMSGHNNNYRIFNKSDGAVLSTVGTATFWAPSGETALNGLTDPRTLYDPYNNRWIAVMQTVTTGAGNILVAVSQTSDPSGNWFLYRFATGATIDFPNVGFNKNWIAVSINRYTNGGTFSRGITLVVNYPMARSGTGSGTVFTQGPGTHFCSAPCATYSATSDTMFVVTHLSSSGGTYSFDTITGTASSPVYTASGALTRPGGGWVQPGGNLLPQSAPNSGASACGATPCTIEAQDAQVRSAPVDRGGFIYYTQTIGLPSSGLTHTAVQWTKLGNDGSFLDGGRIDDATANGTNGGKWYAYPHIAVNSGGDFLVGYSQFSSAQHPSSGYSVHLAADGPGTIRDAVVYKAGEDYYHKTFTTTTGRNRWGDFSQAQVDPSDDLTLWALQEYGKARTGTDDGNTGSNSSRWSTYWASVATAASFTITASAGANGSISPSGVVNVAPGANQGFTITPNACAHVTDVLVDGISVGAVSTYTFTAIAANHTISASFNPDLAVSIGEVVAPEGNGGTTNFNFPVNLSGPCSAPLSVSWKTADGTAQASDGDYLPDSSAVTFAPGEVSHTIPVQVNGDLTPENQEAFAVDLLNPVGVGIAHGQGAGTILNDDSVTGVESGTAPALSLAVLGKNPVSGAALFRVGIPTASETELSVYDVAGRVVARLVSGPMPAGYHTVQWGGRSGNGAIGSGVYFARFRAQGRTLTTRFVILR